ncbi:MAG: hypothetical protein ACOYYS_05020 [Chloroflexota bacterium]
MMIKKLTVTVVAALLLATLIFTDAFALSRQGHSSGWKEISITPPGTIYNGSHESDSDLAEDTIQVTGRLYVGGSMVSSCLDSHPGSSAACNTAKGYTPPWYSARATTNHYFHDAGYKDSSFFSSVDF